MRAVVLRGSGGPELFTVEDVPRPEPGKGEVLIRVDAVSINPVDFKTRLGGGFRDVMGPPPWILGWDVAGTVVSLGAGATRFREGDAVFGLVRFPTLGRTYAEYAAAPENELVPRPAAIDAVAAAALPLVSLTAWQALSLAGLKSGERALILGGAGGVGHVAIGIARAWGAKVAATASAAKAAFLTEQGAVPLDYGRANWAAGVQPFDVVLNTVGPAAWAEAHPAVKSGSRVVHIAGPAGKDPVAGVVELRHLVHPDAASLERIAALVVDGIVKPRVERVYPMTEMGAAHAHLETGRVAGKLVLTW
jgi:NADPH:quinone reductase-like Zn-dependent oxidoreductase